MPEAKFTDQQLIDLYHGKDKPSLYRCAQILGVARATVAARAKKLNLEPRQKAQSDRKVHSILVSPKTMKRVDRLAKKLGIAKADVWERAIEQIYRNYYKIG
jgi:hypothetical protein